MLAKDSRFTLVEYLADRVENVRFFSYGSNMNKSKFKKDMKDACKNLGLNLSKIDKTKLKLDEFAEKQVLLNFRRELSNESDKYGRAFSISPFLEDKVEGICHDVHVSVLPAFLKKEGLFSSKPSYKLIKVCVLGEDQDVLTLLGLKPKPFKCLKPEKIQDTLKYVDDSIRGAEEFDVEHSDMIEMKKKLQDLIRTREKHV